MCRRFLNLLIVVVLFAGVPLVHAQTPPEAWDVSLQQDTLEGVRKVGEFVELRLAVKHPLDTLVVLPEKVGTARWTLVDQNQETIATETGQTTTLSFRFGMFRPGETTLRSFPVTIVDNHDQSRALETKPLTLKVISGLEENRAFTPPLPMVDVWTEDYTLAWVAGIGLAGLLGMLAAFAFMRRQHIEVAEPEIRRPPHETALEKLVALAGDKLIEDGLFMIFYVRMSEAIREYLGERYDFPGTELTTTEILDRLQSIKWPRGISDSEVRQILEHCDYVKFGGFRPANEQAHETLRRCFTIVELTKQLSAPQQTLPAPASTPKTETKTERETETETETETRLDSKSEEAE